MIQIVSAELFCYKFLPRIEGSISGFGPRTSICKELVEPYRLTTLKGAAALHNALDADSNGLSLLKIFYFSCCKYDTPDAFLGCLSDARVATV